MNISQIYEKEKEYKFLKLISQKNINGIIESKFEEYKIKSYIDYQSYKANNDKIESINTRDNLLGIVRIPTVSVDKNGNSGTIEVNNGDCIIYENKKFELIEVRKLKDELKHYYTFYLTDNIENIKFDLYKTELNLLFFKIFKKLGIEAIVYHSFFQNSYFEKIEKPFLTYEIMQVKRANDYTTIKEEISETDKIIFKYRSKRIYKMIVRLYDRGTILNLDTILSKNKILNHIIDELNIKFQNISDLEIQKLDLISESDTIINNGFYNEKVYDIEFTVDTFYSYDNDYIESAKIKGKLKNKED
ncbi:hypothetical protein [Pseudoleptotrichia goodfellowii]|jgi:hypothetical protein|uniref:Uncharacterized protein n=1 Tax=Pseudoleptotrichia goodfellowii TaxID=157692 RepID=A0A510J8F6_9FUSO|nr:hypothetical protein [Pseudoleptotrichia goodfellowii]BBM35454.1 hypothetical protein JCM16774_0367 [Pseudoleptotrichia goodfellowii]